MMGSDNSAAQALGKLQFPFFLLLIFSFQGSLCMSVFCAEQKVTVPVQLGSITRLKLVLLLLRISSEIKQGCGSGDPHSIVSMLIRILI
jgi:hypothetical protein